MRIAVDIRSLTDEYPTGIGLYTKRLLESMIALSPGDDFLLFASGSASVLRRLPIFRQPNVTVTKVRLPNRILSVLVSLPIGVTLESWLPVKPDVWLLPKFNFCKTQIPYWLTVHDLAFDIFPQFITAKERFHNRLVRVPKLVRQAKGLLAVSQSTAIDLEKRWQVEPKKIQVTPLGFDQEAYVPRRQPSDLAYRATYDLNRPYVLALATHEPRKNLESVIEAYEKFRAEGGQNIPLVLAGPEGWKSHHLKHLLRHSPYQHDIIALGYIPDKHKPALYRGATAFIYPSFYEGFGLPVLEALACGLPVITSSTSSLPELVGQAGLMVDPFNVNDIGFALKQILDPITGPDLRQHLSHLAVEQAHKFTWDKTAELTLQALKS